MLAHSSVTDDFVVLLRPATVLLHATVSTQPFAVSYLAVVCTARSPHLHFAVCEVNSLSEGRLMSESLLACMRFSPLQRHLPVLAFRLTVKGDSRHNLEGSFKG